MIVLLSLQILITKQQGGQEDGVGMFTFRDGSTYEGFWHKGKKHGVGIFRPANSSSSTGMDALRTLKLHSSSSVWQRWAVAVLVYLERVLLYMPAWCNPSVWW